MPTLRTLCIRQSSVLFWHSRRLSNNDNDFPNNREGYWSHSLFHSLFVILSDNYLSSFPVDSPGIVTSPIQPTAHSRSGKRRGIFVRWNKCNFSFLFTFMWPCIVTHFSIIKPNRCTNFTNLFWHETLHVSDSSSVHHQDFTRCTLSIGICHTAFEKEHMLLLDSCLQTCMTYTIVECTVNKLLMMDRGTVRNM